MFKLFVTKFLDRLSLQKKPINLGEEKTIEPSDKHIVQKEIANNFEYAFTEGSPPSPIFANLKQFSKLFS